jgi:hypothetical protein
MEKYTRFNLKIHNSKMLLAVYLVIYFVFDDYKLHES